LVFPEKRKEGMKTTLDILQFTERLADMVDSFRGKPSEWLTGRETILKHRITRLARMIEAIEDKERIAWLSFDVAVELMAVKLEIKRRAKKEFPSAGKALLFCCPSEDDMPQPETTFTIH
jgi:hypothetical protein